jgi:hypothetical protein
MRQSVPRVSTRICNRKNANTGYSSLTTADAVLQFTGQQVQAASIIKTREIPKTHQLDCTYTTGTGVSTLPTAFLSTLS